MGKAKIVHLGSSLYGGGAEMVFYQTVSSLQMNDKDEFHHLVATSAPGKDIKMDLILNEFKSNTILDRLNQVFSFRNYYLLKKFLFQEKPEIIHLQNYGNLSPSVLWAISKYKARFPNIKVVQTLHTFQLVCSHYAAFDYKIGKRCMDCQLDRYKIRIFYRICSRGGIIHSWGKGFAGLIADRFYALGLVDQWIVPSEFMKQTVLKRIGGLGRIDLLRNPVMDDFLVKQPQKSLKQNKIVYFGRLSEEKNVMLFIKALEQYKILYYNITHIDVLIIGDGEEKEKLIEEATRIELGFVKFLPFLSSDQLRNAIADAKVLVLPSKCFENSPVSVIEGITEDIYPVVSGYGGMKEIIDWLNVGDSFDGQNEKSLAEHIFHAISNYDLKIGRIVEAKAKISEQLNQTLYSKTLLEFYKNLIGKF